MVLLKIMSVVLLILCSLLSLYCDEEASVGLDRFGNITTHSAWKVLDGHDCGQSAADRIIGGKNAILGQYPWMVRIGYNASDVLDFRCGGALISPDVVITAAHCVNNLEQNTLLTSVRFGEHDTATNPDCEGPKCAPPVQDVMVKKVRSHEKFNNPLYQNDVALIRLEEPVKLNEYVAPICLPKTVATLGGKPLEGEFVTVAGWGKVSMMTHDLATVLQALQIKVLTADDCLAYTTKNKLELTKGQMCAGSEKNRDSCVGDSGGPLMKVFDSNDGPLTYLVGLVSFGPKRCGVAKKPGIYTSAGYFMPWILDNIIDPSFQ